MTRQRDPEDRPADFMEFSSGFAYRPIDHDRLNFLTRYTYVRNIANDAQFQNGLFNGVEFDESAHIFQLDLAYDLHRYLGIIEKIAYKHTTADTNITEDVSLNTFMWGHRFNFHVTRKWDVALEYRLLFQQNAAETFHQGALFEVDRELYDYVRLGVGYDFTDFNDDLREPNSFSSHGPFMRMTGKF